MHLNLTSIINKTDELEALMKNLNFPFVFLAIET